MQTKWGPVCRRATMTSRLSETESPPSPAFPPAAEGGDNS